jgi:hypothetical protein
MVTVRQLSEEDFTQPMSDVTAQADAAVDIWPHVDALEERPRQIHDFVQRIQEQVLSRANAGNDPSRGATVPIRREFPPACGAQKNTTNSHKGRVLAPCCPLS